MVQPISVEKIDGFENVSIIHHIIDLAHNLGKVAVVVLYTFNEDRFVTKRSMFELNEIEKITQDIYDEFDSVKVFYYGGENQDDLRYFELDIKTGVLTNNIDNPLVELFIIIHDDENEEEPYSEDVTEDYESFYYMFDNGAIAKYDVHQNSYFILKGKKWVDHPRILTWVASSEHTYREMNFDEIRKLL